MSVRAWRFKSSPAHQLWSNSFNASIALTTLTEEPPLCAYEGDGLSVARKKFEIKYAVMPGTYSYFLPGDERAPLVTYAINNDRSICSCQKDRASKEAYYFEYGILNEKGYIEWSEEKSWPSEQERRDRFRQIVDQKTKENPNVNYVGEESAIRGDYIKDNNTLITTISENGTFLVRGMDLAENGCGGGLLNLFPFDGVTQSKVCGCDGRGVN